LRENAIPPRKRDMQVMGGGKKKTSHSKTGESPRGGTRLKPGKKNREKKPAWLRKQIERGCWIGSQKKGPDRPGSRNRVASD